MFKPSYSSSVAKGPNYAMFRGMHSDSAISACCHSMNAVTFHREQCAFSRTIYGLATGEFLEDSVMSKPLLDDGPPLTERVNAYDEAHFATYLRLLDAAEEGADWREATGIIFGLDVAADPERAKRIHDTHLARARWMAEAGYRHLLEPGIQ
jgi:hypothetical protein